MNFQAGSSGNDSTTNRVSQRIKEERGRQEAEERGRQEVIPSTIDNHNNRPVTEPTLHESRVAQRIAELEKRDRDNANNHDEPPGLLWGDDGENEAGARITDDNEAAARIADGNDTRKRGLTGFVQTLSDGIKARRQAREGTIRGERGGIPGYNIQ